MEGHQFKAGQNITTEGPSPSIRQINYLAANPLRPSFLRDNQFSVFLMPVCELPPICKLPICELPICENGNLHLEADRHALTFIQSFLWGPCGYLSTKDETQTPMDRKAVLQAIMDDYYPTFDTNRPGLANIYPNASMLTLEGQLFNAIQNAAAKLLGLPFQQWQRSITTIDCQPSGPAGGMPIFVNGNLQLAGDQHALKFSQFPLRHPCAYLSTKDETQTPMDPNAVSNAFVNHYYSTFDTNSPGLANLYQDASMLTFEGQQFQGAQNIAAKLASLPFQQCQHSITTVDCQPSGPAGGLLVFVCGNFQLAGEQHARKFSQLFHLKQTPQGSFYVENDIFRLNYT